MAVGLNDVVRIHKYVPELPPAVASCLPGVSLWHHPTEEICLDVWLTAAAVAEGRPAMLRAPGGQASQSEIEKHYQEVPEDLTSCSEKSGLQQTFVLQYIVRCALQIENKKI